MAGDKPKTYKPLLTPTKDAETKAPGWQVELIPVGGDPEAPSKKFMDLQMSLDRKTMTVRRAGPDGKVQSFEIAVESPADITRLFVAEVIALIAAQANRNFQSQGLGTTMSAPVSFTPEGHVVAEINQRGAVYRRVVFDPGSMKLTVIGSNNTSLCDLTLKETPELTVQLAKVLGVKLPVSKIP